MIQEKDKYRLLIENLPDGLAYCKMVRDNTGKPVDYIFLEINSSFEALTGLPRDHIIGKKMTELYPGIKGLGFDWIGVFNQVTAIEPGQSIRFQQYLSQQDRWYEITAYSDQPGYFAVFFRDITERKQAEDALRTSEDRYRLLVENANEAILVVQDGILKFVNQITTELIGYSGQELTSRPFPEFIHPDDRGMVVERHLRRLKGDVFQTRYAFRLVTRDGSIKWVEIGAVLIDWEGRPATLNFLTDITERKQAEILTLVQRDLALAISFSHELNEALPRCLDTILQLSEMDCGRIYLIDQVSGDLNLICHKNLSPDFAKSVSHYKTDSTYARLVLQGKPLFTNYSEFVLPLDKLEKAEKMRAFIVLPLIFENRVIGCLDLASKKLEDVSEINRGVLKTVTTLMAEGIARLKVEEELKLSYQKLKKAMDATIETMSKIVEAKDPYTSGHQLRVSQLSTAIAKALNLSQDKIEGIRIASLIHDIGKISLPTEILSKPTKLTDIEFSLIKTHSQIGYDILKSIDFSYPVANIVLQHHERLNGSGYPNKLKDDDIFLEARIIGVADVVEAMSSHRPYRPALGIEKALEEISKNKGILYAPEVVDACLKLFKDEGFKF